MKTKLFSPIRASFALLLAFIFAAESALAGPPLICHVFDIGDAKSLPWVSHDWNLSGSETYDTHNLAADTVAILDGSQVTLVHMETLRRATLYARRDPVAAKQLLLRLMARAEAANVSAHGDALAVFDAGYLAEAFKQWPGDSGQNLAAKLDGYALVKKALQLRGNDPQMDFAAALIIVREASEEKQQHARRAIEGAKTDVLLARNLNSRFIGAQSPSMAEMISRNPETKVARQ